MRRLIGLGGLLALTCATAAGQFWDNNIKPNGSSARAISPPRFPNIRIADDFVVSRNDGWGVTDIRYSAVEDAGWVWNDGDGIEVTIYADKFREGPGKILATRTPGGTKVATGNTYFGRAEYVYLADFERNEVMLHSGTYWIGVRHPTAGGSGTNYWMTSDGGPDGKDSSTGYFSLDSGNTWMPEGDIYHHAFAITGRHIHFYDPCDTNCNGSVDLTDVEPFIRLLLGGVPCSKGAGDTNRDGTVDLTDVEGFIECVLG